MGYLLVLLLGVCTGLRTVTPMAVLCWFAFVPGYLEPPLMLTGWRHFTASIVAVAIFTVAALAEYVVDKLPKTPSRTSPGGLIGRILFGVAVGVIIAPRVGGHHYLKGITGGVGAVLGTYCGWFLRTRISAFFKRDLPVALLEDLFTILMSISLLNVITHSDFFR